MSKQRKNQDSELYILGTKESGRKGILSKKQWFMAVGAAIVLIVTAYVAIMLHRPPHDYYFEPENEDEIFDYFAIEVGHTSDSTVIAYIETVEEVVNDIVLYIHTPHHAAMSLTVGMPEKTDSNIVFVAQAADIRADNKEIVGDFVIAGRQLTRGKAKTGYCAVVGGEVTIGVGAQTDLLQKAIDTEGYFFRQYPLVDNGRLVENNPKNKSFRRALAIRNQQVMMIESAERLSFHDFAQALVAIGVSDAIYLVGSTAYGWYYDKDRLRHEFGIEQHNLPKYTNYIIWRTAP